MAGNPTTGGRVFGPMDGCGDEEVVGDDMVCIGEDGSGDRGV